MANVTGYDDAGCRYPVYTREETDERFSHVLVPFTLPVDRWAASTAVSGYGFQAALSIPGVTANHRVDVAFDPASAAAAVAVQMLPGNQSAAGSIIFYAKGKPAAALSGNYFII